MLSNISTVLNARFVTHIQQVGRYGLVGVAALAFDYAIMVILTEYVGVHYLLSAALGFSVGVIINYILAIQFVFNGSKLSSKKLEFTVFAIIGVGGLLLTAGLMWIFTEYFSYHYTHSKCITVALVFLWNFYARKIILFQQ